MRERKKLKKSFIIILVITIILYIALALYSREIYFMEFGEFFGYLFYAVIIAGIITLLWLLLKRPKKEETTD